MARLPVSGQDNGVWGNVLNDYLLQSHTNDGTLKPTAVTSAIGDGSIAQSKVVDLTADLDAKLASANNLSDVADVATARTNLGVPAATGFAAITVGTTPPASPAVGDIWVDTN